MEQEVENSTQKAKGYFSYLLLSLGHGAIKDYLGIPKNWKEVDVENPIDSSKLDNLKNFFSFLFGEGKDKYPVIKESRDITSKLSHVIRSEKAVAYLIRTRDLESAYDLSDGEEKMVLRYLAKANDQLKTVLGIVHLHKTEDVKDEAEKCHKTSQQILKTVKEDE